jgi:hypothetical protein
MLSRNPSLCTYEAAACCCCWCVYHGACSRSPSVCTYYEAAAAIAITTDA